MAKLHKKTSKKKQQQYRLELSKKFWKKLGIISVVIVVIASVGLIASALVTNHKVSQTNISLEDIKNKGATIYDASGAVFATIDISKCAKWINFDELPESLKSQKTIAGDSFATLIVEQFYRDEKEKYILEKALERQYDTKQLQEFFYNTVYLGDGVYGIGSASKRFFGCEYAKASQNAKENFEVIIDNYIRYQTYADLSVDEYEGTMLYEESAYADGVVKELAQILQSDGMDEKSAYDSIYLDGLQIYTNMDASVQSVLDEEFAKRETFSADEKAETYIQSGMVVMNHMGKIVGVAGGNAGDKVYNRALSKNYRIGSTIKPVSVYSLAIEEGIIHFSSMIPNEQTLIRDEDGNEYFWPSNSDNEYGGYVSVTKALQQSKNTVAVEIGRMVGEERMYSFLKSGLEYDLVLINNQNSDMQLSALTLGYLYKGVTLDKITSSYEMFATSGKYYDSAIISLVKNEDGNILYEENNTGKQVISEETAYITNRLLYNNVNGEYGIASKAAFEGSEVLGKTGTVGNGDGMSTSRLFVGITTDYIAGVYIGFDDARPLAMNIYNDPDTIFARVMSKLTYKGDGFERPMGVQGQMYCEKTGMLATRDCEESSIGYYTEDNMPTACTECEDNN